MTTTTRPSLSASEIGNLWMAFQKKTMMARMLEHFIEKAEDDTVREIFTTHYHFDKKGIETITRLFQEEEAAVPVGFTAEDVSIESPRLFDELFDVIYVRVMMKIATGLYALFTTMSYRKDVLNLFRTMTEEAEHTYEKTTSYLLEKGVLARPPMTPLPRKTDFVKNQRYMSGMVLFGKKRPLNTVEISHLYQSLETNMMGMQLMSGFSQGARHRDVKNYFIEGRELSKQIISEISNVFLKSNLQPPAVSSGSPTGSVTSPFSDKLMMYNTNLLSNFGLGSNALGTSFSLRSDLPLKMAKISQDIFAYAKKGGKIMVKHGWMEEPPQSIEQNKR